MTRPAKWMALLLLTVFALASAQPSEEQALFQKGLSAYQKGQYEQAQNAFLEMLRLYPEGRLITAAKLMLGKTYYKLGDYAGVSIIVQNFLRKHPNSKYVDDMHFLLANSYFQQKKYRQAVEEWLWVIRNSTDPRLKRKAGEYVLKTMDHFFTVKDLEKFSPRDRQEFLDGLTTILKAKKLIQQGKVSEGQRILRQFLREQPNHFYSDEARKLLKGRPRPTLAGERFLYLNLTDPDYQQVSEALRLGMQYAIQEYRARHNQTQIALSNAQIESSVLDALQSTYQHLQEENPLAIISSVDLDQSAALAAVSRYEERPVVIPLSSQTGLAGLSDYAFQLNPDVQTKGEFLGRYASQNLGLKHLAVLAPANDYGEGFVQSFIEAAQAGGSEIVTVQWYYTSSTDFSRQFRQIRRQGFFVAFRDSILQVDSTLSQQELRAQFNDYMEEKFKSLGTGGRVDSTQIPAPGIDGLLILTTPDLIQYLAPQYAFHNIPTVLLGNEGWNDPEQLRKFKDYLPELIFVAPGFIDPSSWNFREFASRFRMAMRVTPEIYHLMGYDIMKWVLSNYQPGDTPQQLRDRLANTRPYQGIFTNIQFGDKPRVNSKLTVVKFALGQLLELQ